MNLKRTCLPVVLILFCIIASRTCAASTLDTLLEKEALKLKMQICYSEPLDFNLDGKEDRVAILMNEELMNPVGQFWVVTLRDGKFTVLADLTQHLITEGGIRGLETELWVENNQIHYATRGGSAWAWSTYVVFAYREKRAQIIFKENSSMWLHTGTSDTIEFDYLTSKARIAYERRMTWEEEEPKLRGDSAFYIFQPGIVREPIHIDGVMDKEWQNANWVVIQQDQEMITYGKKNWGGAKDLSLRAKTLIQGNNLHIFAEITDDQVIINDTTDLKQDHLEIWLDSRESIQTEIDPEYNTYGYRHTKTGLYQFAVYKNKVMRYLPQSKAEPHLTSALIKTKTGYTVEVCIPLDRFLTFQLNKSLPIRFTLVVSDTDSITKPAQETLLATSTLQWGNPFTLGAIVLTQPALWNFTN